MGEGEQGAQGQEGQQGAGGSGGAGGNDNWRQSLPEDLQESTALKDVKDVGSLAKQFVDLQRFQGQSIRIPGEDASAEDINAFQEKLMQRVPGLMPTPDLENEENLDKVYTRLGRPEDADGYRVPEFEAGDIPLDTSMIDQFRPVAHKVGLNQKQFEQIVSEMTHGNLEAANAQRSIHDQDIAELSQEWGAAYKERMNKAINIAESTGAPAPLVEVMKNGQASSDTMKWLYSLSKSLGGEGQHMVNQPGASTMTPDEALNQISEIRRNKEHAYWNPQDPAHKSARNKMRELHQLAYPGQGANNGVLSVGVGGLMQS